MASHVQAHVKLTLFLGLVLSILSGATPNKAVVETVEIDGKGHQKAKSHEVHHEKTYDAKHATKHTTPEHGHKEKAAHAGEDSQKVHDAKTATETKHEGAAHAPKAKGGEHHKHSDKEQPAHASMAQQKVFSDEEEDDAALDELEAMTIARTFERKRSPPWGPPAAVPCTWQEWENEGSCGMTCGGRGKTGQNQERLKNPAKHGGGGCQGKSKRGVECAVEECPTTTTTTEEEVTTTTGGTPRMADLSHLAFLSTLMYAFSLFL